MPVSLPARPAAVLAGLLLACAPAAAEGTPEQRDACMDDAYRFCGKLIPNERMIEACLEQNLSRLSPDCRAQFDPPKASKESRSRGKSR
jgi:hypothetical protein